MREQSEEHGTLAIERVCQECAAELTILRDDWDVTQFTGKVVVIDELGGVNELPPSQGRGDGLCSSIGSAGGSAPGAGRSTDRSDSVRGLPNPPVGFGDLGPDLGKSCLDLPPVRRRSLRVWLRDLWISVRVWINEVYFEMHSRKEVKDAGIAVDVRRVPDRRR